MKNINIPVLVMTIILKIVSIATAAIVKIMIDKYSSCSIINLITGIILMVRK